jgi:hypothetical protein
MSWRTLCRQRYISEGSSRHYPTPRSAPGFRLLQRHLEENRPLRLAVAEAAKLGSGSLDMAQVITIKEVPMGRPFDIVQISLNMR